MLYYHSSKKFISPGTIMTGRGEQYRKDWGWEHSNMGKKLHQFKPDHLPGHDESVFMCETPGRIELLLGRKREFICTVKPLDKVYKFDNMNCSSCVGEEEETLLARLKNYWTGESEIESFHMWEFLTRKAEVISCERWI